jgi:hypothetical protein
MANILQDPDFYSISQKKRGKNITYAQNDQSKAKMYVTSSSTTIGSSYLSVVESMKRKIWSTEVVESAGLDRV